MLIDLCVGVCFDLLMSFGQDASSERGTGDLGGVRSGPHTPVGSRKEQARLLRVGEGAMIGSHNPCLGQRLLGSISLKGT